MDFSWEVFREVFPFLLRGARVTIALTVVSLCFGIALGLLLGLARVSPSPVVRNPALAYIEVVRGTPLLMQLIFIYYGLPSLGINLDAYSAGILGLSLNSAAYVGEIFRAGIQSIGKGQLEASRACGLSYVQAMRYVVLPQAVRVVLPPLTNEFVAMLKDTSLVSTLAVAELLRVGREMQAWKANTFSPFAGVALIYLAMTLPMTKLARHFEKRLAAGR
jgi:polar amino acid transport system permease protein